MGAVLGLLVVVVPSAQAVTYSERVVGESSVLGYWRLGDGFGATAAAARGPDGLYQNGPVLSTPGLLANGVDTAVSFDGVDDFVEVAGAPAVSAQFSLEAWVRLGGLPVTERSVVCRGAAYCLRVLGDGRVRVAFSTASDYWMVTSADVLEVDRAYHVVGTHDGQRLRLYVDGVEVAAQELSVAVSTAVVDSSEPLDIGALRGAEPFLGVIDEVALYGAALPAATVAAHYASGSDGQGPVAATGLRATAGDATVAVDWHAVSDTDVVGFRVLRAVDEAGPFAAVAELPRERSEFDDTGVVNEGRYVYVVEALDEHGNGSRSDAVAATPTASTRYRAAVLVEPGLQGYWRLGETAGTVANALRGDAGEYRAMAAGLGAGSLLFEDSNAAATFDGAGDVLVADAERLDVTDAFAIEAWVRREAGDARASEAIVCKAGAYCLEVAEGRWQARLQRGGMETVVYAAGGPVAGATYHVVASYDGERLSLYVNGGLVGWVAVTGAVSRSASPLQVGARGDGDRWRGVIDEPAVYDRALSAVTVADHWGRGAGRRPVAPGGLRVVASDDGYVLLGWTANSEPDLAGYDVYRSTTSGSGYVKLNGRPRTTLTFDDATAVNGTTYYYVIRAVDTSGAVSAPSAQIAASATPYANYAQAVSSAAYGYWRLGETSGTVAAASAGAVDGTYVSGPQLGVAGLLPWTEDPAVRFGSGSSMRVPYGVSTAFANGWSIESWVQFSAVSSSTTGEVVCSDLSFCVSVAAGKWRLAAAPGLTLSVDAPSGPKAGTTYHLVGTYDGARIRLYVNTTLVASRDVTGGGLVSPGGVTVAGSGDTGSLSATVDDVSLYTSALSSALVRLHFKQATDTQPPAAPAGVRAVGGNGQVALSWSANTELDLRDYEVFRSSPGVERKRLARTSSVAFADTDVRNGVKYTYALRALDDVGNASAYSAEVTATPTSLPVLREPETVHANGAELHWSPFDPSADGTFTDYEVHRASSSGFTPSALTRLATIADRHKTRYRDTTAAAGRAFTYKVVTNGVVSNAVTVTLPAEGQARKVLQPDATDGQATYVTDGSCANRGADAALRVASGPSRSRALLAFAVGELPAGAQISRADLELYAERPPAGAMTVDVHALSSEWREGSGRGDCDTQGATWSDALAGVAWATAGGAFDATPVASAPAGSTTGWRSFDVRAAMEQWQGGQAPNLGFMVKASTESTPGEALITFPSDDAAQVPTLRPKLSIDFSEPDVKVAGPTVAVMQPAGAALVSGTAVRVAAEAADDGRVASVAFLVDGAVAATDTQAPFAFDWDTSAIRHDPEVAIVARATDDAGNATDSAAVKVGVDNTLAPDVEITAPTGTYEQTVQEDDPSLFWRLADQTGLQALDSSGHDRDGRLAGNFTLDRPSLVGNDAADRSVQLGPEAPNDVCVPTARAADACDPINPPGSVSTGDLAGEPAFGAQQITAEAWVDYRPAEVPTGTDAQVNHLVSRGAPAEDGSWRLQVAKEINTQDPAGSTLRASFVVRDGTDRTAQVWLDAPGRHHLVGTYDGERVRIFVDGQEPAGSSVVLAGAALQTAAPVKAGGVVGDAMDLDEVAVYGQVLAADRVRVHHDFGRRELYTDTIAADDPAGHWRLGETTGTTAADASGHGNPGTYRGLTTLGADGLIALDDDPAATFSAAPDVSTEPEGDQQPAAVSVAPEDRATDGRVEVPGVQLGATLTAEAWVQAPERLRAGAEQVVMSRGEAGTPGAWQLLLRRDDAAAGSGEHQAVLRVFHGSGVSAASVRIAPGAMHLAGSYDGTTIKVFVDGEQAATTALTGVALNDSAALIIGGALDAELYVDEPAVYAGALSAQRLLAHAVASRPAPVRGVTRIAAAATAKSDDDIGQVEFFLDGRPIGTDATAPYAVEVDTAETDWILDGPHQLTARATDTTGQTAESPATGVDVINAAGTPYQAQISSTPVREAFTWDPAPGAVQESQTLGVTVQNRSLLPWAAGTAALRVRWVDARGAAVPGTTTTLPLADPVLPGATSDNIAVTITPPPLPDATEHETFVLELDLLDTITGSTYRDGGSDGHESAPTNVKKAGEIALGVEEYHAYEQTQVGAGGTHLVNMVSGNSLLTWTPMVAPGRGLSTAIQLTYNTLDATSTSPAGTSMSLSTGGLSRLGSRLQFHPKNAQDKAPDVELIDGDGTIHRFTGQLRDDQPYWVEPAGVHLFLRVYDEGTAPAQKARRWAFTRPDRVTFFYDDRGYPTAVEDANGNRITYGYETIPNGDDKGSETQRISKITDAAGRSYLLSYYTRENGPTSSPATGTAGSASVRGKLWRIANHEGRTQLRFEYYDDGNLRRLVEPGGSLANQLTSSDTASPVAVDERSFVFSYTTPSGDGAALPNEADRVDPPAHTPSQSSRLFSVLDAGHRTLAGDVQRKETRFAYAGPGGGTDKHWRLASRTDRGALKTELTYDDALTASRSTQDLGSNRIRTTAYSFDARGHLTSVVDPAGRTTDWTWTADRHVERITEPSRPGQAERTYTQWSYDANGMVTEISEHPDVTGQARLVTKLDYRHVPAPQPAGAPTRDESARWPAGRTVPHISELMAKTDPNGTATSTIDDYKWRFERDARGNLTKVFDPDTDTATELTPRADGTIESIKDRNGHTTKFAHDDNGLPSVVTDAKGQVTKFFRNKDGWLRAVQDAEHTDPAAGSDGRKVRTYLDYDVFGRVRRQSTPKTANTIIWSTVDFDPNDNTTRTYVDQAGTGPAAGPATTFSYDDMDRQIQVHAPPNSGDSTGDPAGARTRVEFDIAGRMTRVISPRGMLPGARSGDDDKFTARYAYDDLDRLVRQTHYDFPAGVKRELRTYACYDQAGDLASTTAPNADVAPSVFSCASPPARWTTRFAYFDNHRLKTRTDTLGKTRAYTYDATGNQLTERDELDAEWKTTYNERDMPVTVSEPLSVTTDGTTTDRATTRFEYDGVGNLTKQVSPRGVDFGSTDGSYADYATSYRYDAAGQMDRVTLPSSASAPAKYHVHQRYDKVGRLTAITRPTAAATYTDALPGARHTYYRTGWIETSTQSDGPKVSYDYFDDGQQASRTPHKPDGTQNLEQQVSWTYQNDRRMASKTSRLAASTSATTRYAYDANGNLEQSSLSGTAAPVSTTIDPTWDELDRAVTVRERRGTGAWRVTQEGAYDLNGNVGERVEDAEEGNAERPGRKHVYAYDDRDRLVSDDDYGPDTASSADDRQITFGYSATSLLTARAIRKMQGGQLKDYIEHATTYTPNGQPATRATRRTRYTDGAPVVDTTESHTLSYETTDRGRAGVYVNGNIVTDVFTRQSPSADVPCQTGSCTTSYGYDPRDALISASTKVNETETVVADYAYELIGATGNVDKERRNGSVVNDYDYSGDRLDRIKDGYGNVNSKYHYDDAGNIDCITNDYELVRRCTTSAVSGYVKEDYTYDGLQRLLAYRRIKPWLTSTHVEDKTSYVIDPLDRVAEQTQLFHSSGGPEPKKRTTHKRFTHIGLTPLVSEEQHRADSATGTEINRKYFDYDPNGELVELTDRAHEGGTPKTYAYGMDARGSVSQLIDAAAQTTAGVAASYGYSPYGGADSKLTDPTTMSEENGDEPTNPYRYEQLRQDRGSGNTLDYNGIRRFSPATGRFIQRDYYDGALDDLGLSTDRLTQNRYALADGNPVNHWDDGHEPISSFKDRRKANVMRRRAQPRGTSTGVGTGAQRYAFGQTDATTGNGHSGPLENPLDRTRNNTGIGSCLNWHEPGVGSGTDGGCVARSHVETPESRALGRETAMTFTPGGSIVQGAKGLLRGGKWLASAGKSWRESRRIARTGTVWDDVVETQPRYPGSPLPRSFELTAGDTKVWVHGNATEHMAEYLSGLAASGATKAQIDMATQAQLLSLRSAIAEAGKGGLVYGRMLNAGGWELKFGGPRSPGQVPAVVHALYRG